MKGNRRKGWIDKGRKTMARPEDEVVTGGRASAVNVPDRACTILAQELEKGLAAQQADISTRQLPTEVVNMTRVVEIRGGDRKVHASDER